MVGIITDLLVVVVVLGVMIFIHELGHFLAAKAFGVRVVTFALGFGKRLLHYEWGDTDYRINALPFGGYVKMAGDDPTQVRDGHPSEFLSRPRWQRFIIVVMGPAMNGLLAVLLLAGLYRFHFERDYREEPARIGDVESESPAALVGLRPGDLIVRFGRLRNPNWKDVEIDTLTNVGEAVPLEVLRQGGQTLNLTLTLRPEGSNRVGPAGWYPYAPVVIEKVEPDKPASKAGLQPGDQITALDGRRILFWPHFIDALQTRGDKPKPVDLTVLRKGNEMHTTLTPVHDKKDERRWVIGVQLRRAVTVEQLPLREALSASVRDNLRSSLVTFDVLGKIVTRRMSTRSLSGPIGIAQMSGEAYRAGIPELLEFVSFISLQLGIFNLLPIPVLDGGVILLLVIESLMRRDLSLRAKERVVQAGIVFLLLLAVFVMYNDIIRLLRT